IPLCGCTTEPGQPTGTTLRVHHRGAESHGDLAAAMRDWDRGDAIHWRVLGRRIRHFGASGFGGVPGEGRGHEELARLQKRCAGESVADEAAHLWIVAKFLSAVAGDSRDADLLAAAERSRAECGPAYSADAEGVDADESAVGQRVERSERNNRAGHYQ